VTPLSQAMRRHPSVCKRRCGSRPWSGPLAAPVRLPAWCGRV